MASGIGTEPLQQHTAACCKMLEQNLELRTVKELGWGGQGLVLLCQELVSGNRIACKVLASHRDRQQKLMKLKMKRKKASPVDRHVQKLRDGEASQNAHLLRDADLLHQLRGAPGILPLIAKVEGDDGCIHIFTPFCNAGDLFDRLDASLILPERETAHIVASLAGALVSCHARGIVHRDIKPDNVLFCRYTSSSNGSGVASATSQLHRATDIKHGIRPFTHRLSMDGQAYVEFRWANRKEGEWTKCWAAKTPCSNMGGGLKRGPLGRRQLRNQ
ncbi:hypothetical protein L7F22_051145 [Adiantum nelumboides]|nr:hypothetical protein [Adiantum nelumboides]